MSTAVLPPPSALTLPVPPFGPYPLAKCLELARDLPPETALGWMLYLTLQTQSMTFDTKCKVNRLHATESEEPAAEGFQQNALTQLTKRLLDEIGNVRCALRPELDAAAVNAALAVMTTTVEQIRVLTGKPL